jgi:hypothetical protein
MSALAQNLVVRRLFRGKCRDADDPQKFKKHTIITVNSTENDSYNSAN